MKIVIKRAFAAVIFLMMSFLIHSEPAWPHSASCEHTHTGPGRFSSNTCATNNLPCLTATNQQGRCETITTSSGYSNCICSPLLGQGEPTCQYLGDLAGEVDQEVELVMSLCSATTGRPIANREVFFTVGPAENLASGQHTSAVTDRNGIARTVLTLNPPRGTDLVVTQFPGDEKFGSCEDTQEFTVLP